MTHLTDEALRAAYNRYDAGEKVECIAKDYGVSETYMRETWHKRGMWTGFRAVKPQRFRRLTDDQAREAYRLYEKGEMTAQESAIALGVRADTIRDRWRMLGLRANQKHAHRFKGDYLFQGFKRINEGHEHVTHEGVCLVCDQRVSPY